MVVRAGVWLRVEVHRRQGRRCFAGVVTQMSDLAALRKVHVGVMWK